MLKLQPELLYHTAMPVSEEVSYEGLRTTGMWEAGRQNPLQRRQDEGRPHHPLRKQQEEEQPSQQRCWSCGYDLVTWRDVSSRDGAGGPHGEAVYHRLRRCSSSFSCWIRGGPSSGFSCSRFRSSVFCRVFRTVLKPGSKPTEFSCWSLS